MSFLDKVFKKKEDKLDLPELKPADLNQQLPSFKSHVDETLPPKPEDFGVKKEPPLSKEIMPPEPVHTEELQKPEPPVISQPEPTMPEKPEMPEFITAPEPVQEKAKIVAPPVRDTTKPLFILVDDYKQALGYIGEMRQALRESDEVYDALERLRTDEDKAYGLFNKGIEDLQRKFVFVDASLFEKHA